MSKEQDVTYIGSLDTTDKITFSCIIYEGSEKELLEEINKGKNFIKFIGSDEDLNESTIYIKSDNIVSFDVCEFENEYLSSNIIRHDGRDAETEEKLIQDANGNQHKYRGGTLVFSKNKDGEVISEEVKVPHKDISADDIIDEFNSLDLMEYNELSNEINDSLCKNEKTICSIYGSIFHKIIKKFNLNVKLNDVIRNVFQTILLFSMIKKVSINMMEANNEEVVTKDTDLVIFFSAGMVLEALYHILYACEDKDEITDILLDSELFMQWISKNINDI